MKESIRRSVSEASKPAQETTTEDSDESAFYGENSKKFYRNNGRYNKSNNYQEKYSDRKRSNYRNKSRSRSRSASKSPNRKREGRNELGGNEHINYNFNNSPENFGDNVVHVASLAGKGLVDSGTTKSCAGEFGYQNHKEI